MKFVIQKDFVSDCVENKWVGREEVKIRGKKMSQEVILYFK